MKQQDAVMEPRDEAEAEERDLDFELIGALEDVTRGWYGYYWGSWHGYYDWS